LVQHRKVDASCYLINMSKQYLSNNIGPMLSNIIHPIFHNRLIAYPNVKSLL